VDRGLKVLTTTKIPRPKLLRHLIDDNIIHNDYRTLSRQNDSPYGVRFMPNVRLSKNDVDHEFHELPHISDRLRMKDTIR
jgi:hypothetical protein